MIDKTQRNKPELLAPAGDFISLQAAIQAGCDAVYFGVAGFSRTSDRVDVFFAHYFGRPDHGVCHLTTMRFPR